MKALIFILVLTLSGCETDYRTQQERNNGVILTEQQIVVRKSIREVYGRMAQEHLKREMDERRLQRAYIECSTRRIVECL